MCFFAKKSPGTRSRDRLQLATQLPPGKSFKQPHLSFTRSTTHPPATASIPLLTASNGCNPQGNTMKHAATVLIMALCLSIAGAISHAQDPDGPPDGGDGMSRAFGKGNGVRGTITAAAANSFTIRTDEGDTYKVLYSENTRLMKDRQPIEAADIHVGDMLIAGGIVDPKAKTVGAVFVLDVDAKQVSDARAAFGKTWVAGKVTAIPRSENHHRTGRRQTIPGCGSRRKYVLPQAPGRCDPGRYKTRGHRDRAGGAPRRHLFGHHVAHHGPARKGRTAQAPATEPANPQHHPRPGYDGKPRNK